MYLRFVFCCGCCAAAKFFPPFFLVSAHQKRYFSGLELKKMRRKLCRPFELLVHTLVHVFVQFCPKNTFLFQGVVIRKFCGKLCIGISKITIRKLFLVCVICFSFRITVLLLVYVQFT